MQDDDKLKNIFKEIQTVEQNTDKTNKAHGESPNRLLYSKGLFFLQTIVCFVSVFLFHGLILT